jgi:hypothetical protein
MSKRGWVTFLFAAAACGDNTNLRTLEITDPAVPAGTVKKLCAADDKSDVLDGLQYNVKVTATGFASTDVINLSIDGAAPNAQVGQPADGGSVTFSGFTLPEGMHSLAARSSDGEIRSEAVMLNVDTTPPAVAFTSPIGGGTLTTADDTDPNSTGIQFDVKVDAAVEDGQQVLLTLTAPSGAITHVTPVAAAGGKATFTHVSFGEMGTWKLRADATTTCGNPGFATIDIGVGVPPSVPCAVEITPAPVNRPGIANVLNYDLDPDKVKAGFQATIKVRSTAGNNADLFINLLQTGSRTAVGSDGTATFAVDLAEGLGSIQAQCRDTSQNVGASTNNLVFVDTTRPTCAITAPANGKILIPADDIQPGTPGTTEFNVAATVTGTPAQPSGSDTDGELAQFSIDGAVQTATVAGNAASVVGSLGAPKVTVPIEVSGIDRAGNTCTAAITVGYETQGCSIGLSAPTSTVTTDSDNGKAGVQATVVFDIGAACAGKTVTLTGCDVSGAPLTAQATAGATPTATFTSVTLCAQQSCALSSRTCTAEVTNDAGITTSKVSTISVDTQPPSLIVTTFQPPSRCGGSVTPTDDVDNDPSNGVQIRVLVTGAAVSKWIETDPPGDGTRITLDAGNFANITLATGSNVIVAKGTDEGGLVGTSAPCTVTLGTLALAITSPTNGATLGTADGTVNGNNLAVNVCGTVGDPANASVAVRVDGDAGSDVAATVNPNGTWCANGVLVPSGSHSLNASATSTGGGAGTAAVSVTVDLAGPEPPTGFSATEARRNAVLIEWTAPQDAGGGAAAQCEIRTSPLPIPTPEVWEALPAGTIIPSAPPGTQQSTVLAPLKTGRDLVFGLRCFDAAGNGSDVVANPAPIRLSFTSSATLIPAAVTGFDVTLAGFGTSATGADLNGDGFKDLIVGAPSACRPVTGACPADQVGEGLVYIYMGSATGIAATPSFVIRGTDASGSGQLGAAVATIDWNHDGVDDVAIGAPFAGETQGIVYIFLGESGAASKWTPVPSTLTPLDDEAGADVKIFPDQTDTWLVGATFFGFTLATLDFDNDGSQDLAIAAAAALDAGGLPAGGGIVLYGPPAGTPVAAQIGIPGDLGTGAGKAGTVAVAFQFTGGEQYGTTMANLGHVSNDVLDDLAFGPADLDDSAFTPSIFVFYGRGRTGAPFTKLSADTEVKETIVSSTTADHSNFPTVIGSYLDPAVGGQRAIMASDIEFANGQVFIVPGGTLTPPAVKTLTGAASIIVQGPATGTKFGAGLANNALGLGSDVDGDGIEDVVAAGGQAKSLYVWYGTATRSGVGVTIDDTVVGPAAFIETTGVFWIGDTNGDGLSDLAFTDAQVNFNNRGPGAVVILK